MPDRKTTTQQGLGWEHQRVRRRLLTAHVDGTPCPCLALNDCGPGCLCRRAGGPLPMYRDAALNPDGLPLEADHTLARSLGGRRADRLLLATCNRSRGDGTRRADPTLDHNYLAPWWTRDWLGLAGLSPHGTPKP